MNLSNAQRRRPADIDVTSFSDIAFLLIIFFIVSTTFAGMFGRLLNIPSGTSDASKKSDKQITISLAADQIHYGEKADQLGLDELRGRLLTEDFPNRRPELRLVIVQCTKDVPYDLYFKVVTAVTSAGGVLALLEEEETGKPGGAP